MILAPVVFEPGDGGLDQLPAFGRDLVGGVEIVEVAHLKTEVAVKRVDKNFKSRLQRVEIDPAFFVRRAARELFGFDRKPRRSLSNPAKTPSSSVCGR